MKLLNVFSRTKPMPETLPAFIRNAEDVRGIRVLRLHGPVGKEIGQQVMAADEAAARRENVFDRSLLIDFEGTTGWDFVTIGYLVQALRRRMAAHAQVGIINAPPQLIAEMEMSHVARLFKVFESEERALAELSGQQPGSESGE